MNIFSPKMLRLLIISIVIIASIVLIISSIGYTISVAETTSPEGRYKVDVTGKVILAVSPPDAEYLIRWTNVDWELQEVEDISFFPDLGPFWIWETSNVDIRGILYNDDNIVADSTQSLGSFNKWFGSEAEFDLHMKNIQPSNETFTLYLEVYEGNELKLRVEHSSWNMLPKVT